MATRIIPSRDLVSQESIQFIREQILTITLAEFRPNSRVHVFFDGVNVDQYCATYGNAIGTAIYSDIRGKASIMFSVPANTFNTGVREVVLTESANLSSISIAGTQFVTAKTQFNANGTKQIFQNKEKTIVTVDRIIPIQAQDPLAQSFFTYGITGGAFLSSIDLYFFSKDPVLPVRVEIRAMENGYPAKLDPDNTHHISIVEPNMVATSSDASIATKFVFDPPIYMKEDNDYCFVVRSNSDKYNLFTSKMGERSLEDDTIISQQPYIGSLFKSENNITWVAEQFEDIKFTLNKAVFETNTPGIIKLRAVYPWTRAESTHFSTTSGSNVITYSGGYDHGLEVGSKIGVYAETGLVFNGIPSSQFSGTKTVTAVLDRKTVTFTTTSAATATGTIISGGKVNQLFISEGGENYSLSDSISIIGGGGSGATASMVLTDGVITSVTITNPGTGYTSDPYVVVLTSTGTGAKIIANVAPFMSVQTNKPVSMIVPRVPVYNYGSSSNTMIMNTTLGNYEGGNLTTYAPGNYIALRNGIPHTLDQASVIANLSNEQTFMSGNPSCEIEVRFTTDNPNVQPILDTSISSIISAMSPSVNNQSGESLFATASSGYVNGYTITAGGSAYTEAPAVVISDPELPGGVTATATASLTGSTVTGITVTNPGSGYLSTPTATILRSGSDVTGNGAAVQFTLAEFNSELMQSGGTAASKYITTKIKLEIPSTGARLYANISSLPTTNVDWYIRTSMSTSTADHDSGSWVKMSCNLARDRSNFIGEYFEYEFRADQLETYDTYDLKCVMHATNPVQTPSVKSYRVITIA